MEGISYSCSICQRICKNKRGLARHETKCKNNNNTTCSYCNETFSRLSCLLKHQDVCVEYKLHTLKKRLKEEYEDRIQNILEEKEKTILELRQEKEEAITQSNQIILQKDKALTLMKQEWDRDVKCKVSLYEHDLKIAQTTVQEQSQKIKEFEKETTKLKSLVEEQQATINMDRLKIISILERSNDKQPTSIVSNNNSVNNNNNSVNHIYQLQVFDPSMFQGRINPPDVTIKNVNDLLDYMFRLGVSNSYRLTDKSRGTGIWSKLGIGEIKDPKCAELANYTVDTLLEDIQRQKAYWIGEHERLSSLPEKDQYRIRELQKLIDFCDQLTHKDEKIMKNIQQIYAKRGKSKTDTSVDKVYDMTYVSFCQQISNAMIPHITKWIDLSPYELGLYLKERIGSGYQTEPASQEQLFIIIKDDSNQKHIIHAKDFEPLFQPILDDIFQLEYVRNVFVDVLTNKTTLSQPNVERWIEYFLSEGGSDTRDITNEVMRGLVQI